MYSLDVLLFLFGTSLLFHVQFSCFLTCIQVSQESRQMVWYSHLFQNFPQFIVIHTVKGFGITNYRNANPNYTEISPHTSQNDHHQKIYK